jgi:hypothetical protein
VAGLIFIDTNKLLDFYRQGGKSAFGLVDILLSQRDRVILTEQVWVEFRKHRQKLMDELWHKVEVAKSSTDPLPAAFKEYKHSKFLQDDVIFDKAKDQIKREIEDLIWKPDEDPVYDRLMQLYRSESALHLRRTSEGFPEVYAAARLRANLGYPPGKARPESIGDAINWEWILRVASRTNMEDGPIVLVSADGDFGLHFGRGSNRRSYLNDFLDQEFVEHSAGTKIIFLDTISDGLGEIGVPVTKEIQRAEKELLDWYRSRGY